MVINVTMMWWSCDGHVMIMWSIKKTWMIAITALWRTNEAHAKIIVFLIWREQGCIKTINIVLFCLLISHSEIRKWYLLSRMEFDSRACCYKWNFENTWLSHVAIPQFWEVHVVISTISCVDHGKRQCRYHSFWWGSCELQESVMWGIVWMPWGCLVNYRCWSCEVHVCWYRAVAIWCPGGSQWRWREDHTTVMWCPCWYWWVDVMWCPRRSEDGEYATELEHRQNGWTGQHVISSNACRGFV